MGREAALLLALLAGCLAAVPEPPAPAWRLDCADEAACSTLATAGAGPANENMLAVNPTDPRHVVVAAKDYSPAASDCVWAGLSLTWDGGATWESAWVGGPREERADPRHPLFGWQCVTDPMTAFLPDGTLLYFVEAYGRVPRAAAGRELPHPLPTAGGAALFVAASEDGGRTWPPERIVRLAESDGFSEFDDRTCAAVDSATGAVHLGWTRRGPDSAALGATSRDGGATWSAPIRLNPLGERDFPFPVCPVVAGGGTVHVTWNLLFGGGVYLATSQDDGATFGEARRIHESEPRLAEPAEPAEFYTITQPFAAVDRSGGPRDGWIYLVWAPDVEGRLDVLLSVSRDGGATWSPPAPVGPPTAADRFHPTVAVDEGGGLHLTLYDRSYAAGNRLVDAAWAFSDDGGATFAFTRLSAESFDGDLGAHQEGHPFLGDYNGLAFAGDVGYASWSDARTGRSDVAVARLVRA